MSEFIVCYDICHPARLGRVFRYLRKWAVPLQYSVFLFSGTELQLERCLAGLVQLIDMENDDLRAYPLPARGHKSRMGKPALPVGIQLSGLPVGW